MLNDRVTVHFVPRIPSQSGRKRVARCVVIFLVFSVFMLSVHTGEAETFRSITAVSYIDYDQIGLSKVFESAMIARIHPRLSLLVKGYHDHRADWNNTIVTAGPVIIIDRHHYLELTYGHGNDADDTKADFYTIEMTREMPRYLTGLGMRHGRYPGYSYTVMSPSIRYRVNTRWSLWGKYFASFDSDENFDHALWVDVEYRVTMKNAIKAGFTSGNRLYSPEYEYRIGGNADMSFYSLLAEYIFMASERLTIKYHYESLLREEKYRDSKNIIIVDIRF